MTSPAPQSQFRETSPHYYRAKSYPARWWKKQAPNFFPAWSTKWDTPKAWDYDPWFDNNLESTSLEIDITPGLLHHHEKHIPESVANRHALLLAMIEQAQADVRSYGRREPVACKRAETAMDWFLSDSDEEVPGSFVWCCSHLNLAPDPIRKWCEQYSSKIRHVLFELRNKKQGEREHREQTLRVRDRQEREARAVVALSKFEVTPAQSESLDRHSTFVDVHEQPLSTYSRLVEAEPLESKTTYISFVGGPLNGTRREWEQGGDLPEFARDAIRAQHGYVVSHSQLHATALYIYMIQEVPITP